MTPQNTPDPIDPIDEDFVPARPARIRNRSLADDGLPKEMFQDVKRACHRHLLETDQSYADEQERITLWCSRKGISRAANSIPAPQPQKDHEKPLSVDPGAK
jgi:hypothetical protein